MTLATKSRWWLRVTTPQRSRDWTKHGAWTLQAKISSTLVLKTEPCAVSTLINTKWFGTLTWTWTYKARLYQWTQPQKIWRRLLKPSALHRALKRMQLPSVCVMVLYASTRLDTWSSVRKLPQSGQRTSNSPLTWTLWSCPVMTTSFTNVTFRMVSRNWKRRSSASPAHLSLTSISLQIRSTYVRQMALTSYCFTTWNHAIRT